MMPTHPVAMVCSACAAVRRLAPLSATPCGLGSARSYCHDGVSGGSDPPHAPASSSSSSSARGRRSFVRGRVPVEQNERASFGRLHQGTTLSDTAMASHAAAVAPRLLTLVQQRLAASESLCATSSGSSSSSACPAHAAASSAASTGPVLHDASHSLRPGVAAHHNHRRSDCSASPDVFQDAAATAQKWLASRDPSLVTAFAASSTSSSPPSATSSMTSQQRMFTSTAEATASRASTTEATNSSTAEESAETPAATADEDSTKHTASDSQIGNDGANDEAGEDTTVRPSPTFRSMCEACKLLGLLHPGGATRGDWDKAELKTVYRALARSFHPDIEGGDVRSMEQINDAYQLLVSLTKAERLSFETWINEGGEAALAAEDALLDGSGHPSIVAAVSDYLAVSSATTIASVAVFAYYYVYHLAPAAEKKRLEAERVAAEKAAAEAAVKSRRGFYRTRRAAPSQLGGAHATSHDGSTAAVLTPRPTLGQRVDAFLALPLMSWLREYGMMVAIALVACLNGALLRNAVVRRAMRP